MEFRRDKALVTLRAVVEALVQERAATPPEALALIRQHGPLIASAEPFTTVSRIIDLLNALAALADRLPIAAVQALEAGQTSPAAAAPALHGGVEVVDEPDRQSLLRLLAGLADFRVFSDPGQLATDLIALVRSHEDRLTGEELVAWRRLLAAYEQGGDATTFLREAEALLGHYPKVARLLEDGKAWLPPARPKIYRGGYLESAPASDRSLARRAYAEAFDAASDSETLERYANLHFPAAVLLSQRMVPLIVHIAREYAQTETQRITREEARVTLRPGDLALALHADGFEVAQVIGGRPVSGAPAVRMVKIERERDAEPVIFFLNPLLAGRQRISLDIYQFDRAIATLAFEVEVIAQGALERVEMIRLTGMPIVSPGESAQPPDLELRVTLSADGRTLSYMLHAPLTGDYNFKPAGSVTLAADARRFLQPTFDKLSELARLSEGDRTAGETTRAIQELADIGSYLYDKLFSAELKAEYRKFWARYRGKGLLITSDETFIPWEMIRPYEADENGEPLYPDAPLCELFHLTRWLAGRGAPDRVAFRRGVYVAPPDNLEAARREAEYFQGVHRLQWDIALEGPLSSLSEVEDRFRRGDAALFHFACHGNFNTEDPDESKLKLAGDFLRPSQITGPKQAGIRKAKPVVFLNACHAGQTGIALTGIGGWAARFIESGASAFIGSLWEINDRLAAQFAMEFYDRLWGLNGREKMPLGRAFHEARLAIRDADPANPTWLAYVLYGDPYGQVVLGTTQ